VLNRLAETSSVEALPADGIPTDANNIRAFRGDQHDGSFRFLPRINAKLCFAEDWERQAFGVALALSKAGHFDWEDFRQNLITAIGEWENSHSLDDASWSDYERWLTALERVVIEAELVTVDELAKLGGRDKGSPALREPAIAASRVGS
jgi:nitrile hydratase accessory protein